MLAYCVPIFTKSGTIIYLSAELDNNSICVIGPRCPLSPNDCLHFRSQRNCFQRPPVNIGDPSLRNSQWDARTVSVWPIRSQDSDSEAFPVISLLNWEREAGYSILSDGRQIGRDGHVTFVTSSWHVTRAWHHGDWRHHGRVLCSCWVASDIQSSIRGRYLNKTQTIQYCSSPSLFGSHTHQQ